MRFCTHFYLAIDAECSIDREREAALNKAASFVFGPFRIEPFGRLGVESGRLRPLLLR